MNAVSIDEDTKKKICNGEIVYHCYIKGTFKEVLELNNFPFDYQKLTLTLSAKCNAASLKLENDPEKEDNIRTDNFFAPQEWKLCSHVLTESKEPVETRGASSNRYPQYEFRMNVRRQYKFYIYNVFLVMFLITALTFGSFAVEADATGDRIQISLTLLLTSVAFKYHVQQFVPTVSYLTLIDKYILLCMVFQFLITLHNIFGGLITNLKALLIFEWVCFGIALLLFILIHLVVGCFSVKYIKDVKSMERCDGKLFNERKPIQVMDSEVTFRCQTVSTIEVERRFK